MVLRAAKRRAAPTVLSPAYRAWVAENLARGAEEAEVRAALTLRGVPALVAAAAVARASRSPELQGALAASRDARRAELTAALRHDLRRAGGTALERCRMPAPDEFLRRWYATGTPAIFTDIVPRWPAFGRWSAEDLRTRFGAAEIEMSIGREGDPDPDVRFKTHCRTTTMADYVDRVLAAGATNDLYLIANNRNLARPGLQGLLDDIRLPPGLFDERHSAACGALWFGPAGTVTSLHHDTSNIFFFQVVGRKRIRLYPPDEPALLSRARGVYSAVDPERDAAELAGTFAYDEVLAPGDALFLPVGWWHHVRALDLSVSVAFNNFVWDNQFEWYKPGTVA
jgi:hypothetical protein